jgi:hypothetical protein
MRVLPHDVLVPIAPSPFMSVPVSPVMMMRFVALLNSETRLAVSSATLVCETHNNTTLQTRWLRGLFCVW